MSQKSVASPKERKDENIPSSKLEINNLQKYGEVNELKDITIDSKVNEFDERPVMTNNKTFEQLLAEKLKLEEDTIQTSPINYAAPGKQLFLKTMT